jgi:hypothetical protein
MRSIRPLLRKVNNSCLPVISTHTPVDAATIPVIFLFYFFYDIAYTPMLVAYTLEILPYKIRAKGFAVMVGLIYCVFFRSLPNPFIARI